MKIDLYKKLNLLLFPCLLALAACNSDDDGDDAARQLAIDQEIIEDYLDSNGLTAEKANAGFYFSPVVSNEGGKVINTDDIASIYYTLSILGGQTLHTVQAPAEPIQLALGGFSAIPIALEAALEEMREGEVFDFYMPSGFAYGTYSYQNLIPSLAITRLQIAVVRVDDEESQKDFETEKILAYIEEQGLEGEEARDDGLYYVLTEAGEGDLPTEGRNISVHYTGTFLNGDEFDSSLDGQPLTFQLGAGQVIPGWDLGFKDLRQGEKGILFIPSHLAYGLNIHVAPPDIIQDLINRGSIRPNVTPPAIPPFSPLVFEVEVVSIL